MGILSSSMRQRITASILARMTMDALASFEVFCRLTITYSQACGESKGMPPGIPGGCGLRPGMPNRSSSRVCLSSKEQRPPLLAAHKRADTTNVCRRTASPPRYKYMENVNVPQHGMAHVDVAAGGTPRGYADRLPPVRTFRK